MSLKLVPIALLLFVAIAVGVGHSVRSADADITGALVPSATAMESGAAPVSIIVPLDGVNPTDDVQINIFGLDANPAITGVLLVTGCTPACGDTGESTNSDATPIIVNEDAQSQVVLALALTCTSNATVTITADTGNADAQSVFISCTVPAPDPEPTPGGGGEQLLGFGHVVVTASPNLLPCEGGTTTLTAEVVDVFGNLLDDAEFRFATTAGLLVQTSPDTATLTLGPNQVLATVSASIPDSADEEIDTATVSVSLKCNDFATVVLTASPNVVDCTGTTTLTASVRDVNGHVVEGVGFHFVTSTGLLEVDPNNASTEEGRATLRLRPGDGDATVIVSVGNQVGTFEDLDTQEANFDDSELGFVTVQQNCLGTTTGLIRINSSQKNIVCGENVFVGLSVIDEDIQTVIDETPLTLIATHGGFYGGVVDGGEQAILPAAQVPTSHGEANTIYTAPTNYNGEVRITAASGDTYGYAVLNVSGCTTAAAAPATGGGTSAAAPCTPIGDGVCISAPNTGRNQITPPSTGSAGLK